MRIHTNDYKNNIKLYGRQLDSIISYTSGNELIELGAEELNSVNIHYQGSILKSVMKQLDIDSTVEIPVNTVINYQFGVKTGNAYEYINFGNYIVYSVEKQEDTQSYKILCYDKILYSMKNYQNIGVQYPITIRDYINSLCEYLGLEFLNINDTFVNYDKQIQNELFLDEEGNSLEYTFRDVLDQLAEVTASTICINETNDKLELRYITDTEDIIDEEYLKNINVNFGKKFGPINSIVLSRSAESDNVYLRDEDSISLNGLCEIKIIDNQIMNFNDRSDYLADILDQLDGLEYYINDFSSTGITYYELCDMYHVSIDNNIYNCIMFNDEIDVTQGLEEHVFTEMPKETVTDYLKADKTDRKVNQTWIIANKQEGYIESLTSRTTYLENNTYSIEQVNDLVQNAETGLTNTFTEAGGNNIFRNTGLWFKDENDTFEYWNGNVKRTTNDDASNNNSMILQSGSLIQEQNVPNGNYTVSFNYQLLNQLATAIVKINGIEFALENTDISLFEQTVNVNTKNIKIEFITDIDDSVEVYNLMCNAGSVKLAYSQNQNETTTDTVNISKGITITSTNMETIFKANANGIRILTLNENLIAYFTDKGLSTKELVVENEAQIVKTLWQDVGDQTWITRM